MKQISINDFTEITYKSSIDTIFIKWRYKSRCMSIMVFHEQLNNLFATIMRCNADILFIDNYDFDFPILEPSINFIKELVSKFKINKCVMIKSTHLLGNKAIQRLLFKIKCLDVNIVFYNTRKEGELYINELACCRNKNK
jgi:hypothetical protein